MIHFKRLYQSGITGLLTLAVLLTTAFSGLAAAPGSISLEMSNGNITIHVYQIGTLAAKNNQWQFTQNIDFASITFSLDDLDEINGIETKRAKAAELAAFAIDSNVPVYQQGVGDAYGSLTFSDMAEGVYLMVKTNDTAAHVTIEPFFVTMPTQKQDYTGYEWSVTCKPKSEYTIVKNHNSSGGSSSRGSSGSSSGTAPESSTAAPVTLPDESIPLGDYDTADSPVFLTGFPQTGDNAVSVLVLSFLMGASLGGMVFLLRKKSPRN